MPDNDNTPRTARTVRRLAEANGWTLVSTWAYKVTRPGRPPTIVDSYALRMANGQRTMWAVWLDGKYDAGQIWRPGCIPVSVSLTEIRREIIA